MQDGCEQGLSAPESRIHYSLLVQSDGHAFVRAFGFEPESVVIGPFEDEALARTWLGGSPMLHRGYEYWRSRKQGSQLPLNRDIDGGEIEGLSSNIAITEIRRDPFAICYRTIGAETMRMFDAYRPGALLSAELENEDGFIHWTKVYREACETKNPQFGRDVSRTRQAGEVKYDWMILPFVDERGEVVMTLDVYEALPSP